MKIAISLKLLTIVLSVIFLFFIPLLISLGDPRIYCSFTGIIFTGIGIVGLTTILYVIVRYALKIPEQVIIDHSRRVLKLQYSHRILELPFTNIYCVDLKQYLEKCLGCIVLPGLIIGKFKTIDNEYIEVYSVSNKAIVVEGINGEKYAFTAPRDYC